VTSSKPALRLPWIWGKDTFTTLVSMISMNVGNITVRAMAHLFAFNSDFMDPIVRSRDFQCQFPHSQI
jgi:hypothetical protein